jgi:D-alanyl-D-alanine carboxypeptidase
VAAFLVLVALVATQVATGWVARVAPSLFERGDPSWEAMDWTELGPALAERGLLADTTRFVAAPSWIDAGKVAYALGPDVPTVCLCDSPHQFRFLDPQSAFLGRDAVIVEKTPRGDADPAAEFTPYFRSVEQVGRVTLHRLAHPELTLTILVGYGFKRSRAGQGPSGS